ncbi:MAG TPA: four helix bundle protein [Opitutaceae bacterium]|nr:four helix bundle protein [Opitutaceae bacterium]
MENAKTIQCFEDLNVWQLAIELAATIYQIFEHSRDYSFKDQIQRAAISISSNIAEGYERGSNKEFVQFLYYAKGSCGEVRSQAQLAMRVHLIELGHAQRIVADAKLLSGKLGSYIKVRKTSFK